MKWFQHQSNSHRDFNVEPFIEKYGLEGYGLFWICAEMVAEKGIDYKIHNEIRWKRYLSTRAKFPEAKLNEILLDMAEYDLIDKNALEKGFLYMPKMSNYSDDYTKKVRRASEHTTDSVRRVSESVGLDKIREDKIRLNKIRLDKKKKLSLSQLKQNDLFDDIDLDLLKTLYDLGYKCPEGKENDLSNWIQDLEKEFSDINWKTELKKFKDYWEAQSRKIKTHKLAWRNWLINAKNYAKNNSR